MRINKYIFPLGALLTSFISLGYASWQFNDGYININETFLNITGNWKFDMSMDANGKIYEDGKEIGVITYDDNKHDTDGGTVTTDISIIDNGKPGVTNYLATQVGSEWHIFTEANVYINMPKGVYNEESGTEYPICGIDHLGAYTTIGGLIRHREVTINIPDTYEFIGNYAFYLVGSDHSDTFIEYNIPSSVTYIGHEAFNFSTLNHMKDMNDQKYKFRVNYDGTAEEFINLINNSKAEYEAKYVGVKKVEMEEKTRSFQKEVNNTGGIIYSGSTEYSWFFRPSGQVMRENNSTYWPAQYDYIDVYCLENPLTGKKEVVRYTASSPIAEECKNKISHYVDKEETLKVDPIIITLD